MVCIVPMREREKVKERETMLPPLDLKRYNKNSGSLSLTTMQLGVIVIIFNNQ